MRSECGDFVNLFWPNLTHWSCMLWDPKGFPTMLYEMNKYEVSSAEDSLRDFPRTFKLFFNSLSLAQLLHILPKNYSKVKDQKMLFKIMLERNVKRERSGILEYLADISKTDEHYFRVHENSDCVVLGNIGIPVASHIPPLLAGHSEMPEKGVQEWSAIETRCIGLGDPYCEIKLAKGEIPELKQSLEKDNILVGEIHERLVEKVAGFILEGKPLVERPRLGSEVHMHMVLHGMGYLNLVGEKYRRAQMMGGARSAKIIGERLMEAGLSEDETIKRVISFMNYCKVGKVTLGETVRIRENCESFRATIMKHVKQPSCFFTTGFLNGLFSAVKNKHVREIRCVAAGDPYCEWEII